MRLFFVMFVTLLPLACGRAKLPGEPARLVVCATSFPLANVARQIGGEGMKIDWIIDLGDPIEHVVLNTDERARFGNVDFALCDGVRTEPWAQQELFSISNTDRLLSLDQLPIAATTPPAGLLWLDPLVVRQFVPVLVDRCALRSPPRADAFRARGTAFVAALDAVVKEYPNSAFGRGRVLITSNLFAPLLDRFGIGSFLVEADPLRLDDDAIDNLTTVGRREGIRTLLLPFDTPPGTITDIEERTHTKAFLIDPLGYANYPTTAIIFRS